MVASLHLSQASDPCRLSTRKVARAASPGRCLFQLQLVGLIPVVGLFSAIASLFGFGAVLLVDGAPCEARHGQWERDWELPCPRGGDRCCYPRCGSCTSGASA